MRNLFHRSVLLLALLASAWVCHADTEVLWWLVDGTEQVDWYGSTTTVGALPSILGEEDILARVRVDSGGTTDGYLTFWQLDGQGGYYPAASDVGVVISDWSVPVNGYADLTDYNSASYSFAIELGNYTDPDDPDSWVAVVTSGTQTYTALKEGGHIAEWNGVQAIPGSEWKTTYAVPEPNSGLLLLLGGALLALRRRRNGGRA